MEPYRIECICGKPITGKYCSGGHDGRRCKMLIKERLTYGKGDFRREAKANNSMPRFNSETKICDGLLRYGICEFNGAHVSGGGETKFMNKIS